MIRDRGARKSYRYLNPHTDGVKKEPLDSDWEGGGEKKGEGFILIRRVLYGSPSEVYTYVQCTYIVQCRYTIHV